MRAKAFFARLLTLFALVYSLSALARDQSGTITLAELPAEARATLTLIRQGGPFPYAKDGAVFGNYERILPKRKRGYYHEFTVPTPGARNRGARRIVTGGPPNLLQESYYTPDHYATFKRIIE